MHTFPGEGCHGTILSRADPLCFHGYNLQVVVTDPQVIPSPQGTATFMPHFPDCAIPPQGKSSALNTGDSEWSRAGAQQEKEEGSQQPTARRISHLEFVCITGQNGLLQSSVKNTTIPVQAEFDQTKTAVSALLLQKNSHYLFRHSP